MRSQSEFLLTSDEILKIARIDAEKAYRDLSGYRIRITLAEGASEWNVEYEIKDANAQGGGAIYAIHALTGKIISKKYFQ